MKKRPVDPAMSLTTPTMTWELEAACHVMCGERGMSNAPKLGTYLDQKYGAGKWHFCGMGRTAHVDDDGVHWLDNRLLAQHAVEAGMAELRKQIAEYDAAARSEAA